MSEPMDRPKLRNVERIPHERDDGPHIILRDPMGVAPAVAIDAEFAPVLDALDGTRTVPQIRQSLKMTRGLDVALDDLVAFCSELEDAALLDGDAFRERWADLHEAFLAAPHRATTLAGTLYPEDPTQLRAVLGEALGSPSPSRADTRAVLVPHGPPDLVAPVLRDALAWLPAADDVDLVLMIGADHHPGLLPCAVVDKPYATPLGVASTARGEIAATLRRVPWLDREAIRHRTAHSLEWATLYLQHAWGTKVPPCFPLLCGSATITARGELHEGIAEVVAALDGALESGRVLVVVAAELTHAGPAYGRREIDANERSALAERDRAVLAAVHRGRTADVLAAASDLFDQGRPSGLPPLLLLSELITGLRGADSRYELVRVAEGAQGWVGCAASRFRGA